MDRLDLLFETFSLRRQVEGLKPDAQGVYLLDIDGLTIRCFEKFELIHLVFSLGKMPDTASEQYIQHLLKYALARMQKSRCALVLTDDDEIQLFDRISANTSDHEFEEEVEQFVNVSQQYEEFMRREQGTAARQKSNIMMEIRP